MQCLNRRTAIAGNAVLLCVILVCPGVRAQEVGNPSPADEAVKNEAAAERFLMTGKDLFSHQWEWTGPAKQPEPDVLAALVTPRQRLSPQQRSSFDAMMVARIRSRATTPIDNDGLGPLHNADSCAACHVSGGGSGVEHNVTLITVDPRSEVIETPRGGYQIRNLFPGLLDASGGLVFNTLVHDRSTRDGYAEIRNGLADYVPEELEDAWFDPQQRTSAAIAKRPVIAGRHDSIDFYLSQRNSPALFGLGVIESISAQRLRGIATKQAANTNGEISGRFAGKFGWRGQVATLRQFVTGACASELGLNQARSTQADDPADPSYVNFGEDVSSEDVAKLLSFIQSLPRPVESPGEHSIAEVLDGEKLFNSTGCVTCHMADVHPVSGMFSDLLLHDMGQNLQAPFPAPIGDLRSVLTISPPVFVRSTPRVPRPTTSSSFAYYGSPGRVAPPQPYPFAKPEQPQFPRGELPDDAVAENATWDAMQREWKTPPLWGVADTAPYLHDGRAETLDEAIRWHGGEAKSARKAYEKLSDADRDLVLAFLSSLRAPYIPTLADKID